MGDRGDKFDSVARGLADGSVSRRRALRMMGAAAMGLLVPTTMLVGNASASTCPPARLCRGVCCPRGSICRNRRCQCTGGKHMCRRTCVSLQTNRQHCGACGHVCASGSSCVGGVCVPNAVCGNGVIEGSEVCDGVSLGGATCQSLGFSGGTLACLPDCTGYDTSNCVPNAVCGNGVIEAGEVCDGVNLGGATCQSLGFSGGTLACLPDCTGYDTSNCVI